MERRVEVVLLLLRLVDNAALAHHQKARVADVHREEPARLVVQHEDAGRTAAYTQSETKRPRRFSFHSVHRGNFPRLSYQDNTGYTMLKEHSPLCTRFIFVRIFFLTCDGSLRVGEFAEGGREEVSRPVRAPLVADADYALDRVKQRVRKVTRVHAVRPPATNAVGNTLILDRRHRSVVDKYHLRIW